MTETRGLYGSTTPERSEGSVGGYRSRHRLKTNNKVGGGQSVAPVSFMMFERLIVRSLRSNWRAEKTLARRYMHDAWAMTTASRPCICSCESVEGSSRLPPGCVEAFDLRIPSTAAARLSAGILSDMHWHIFWLPVTRHSFMKSSARAAVDRPEASTQKTRPKETIRIEYSPENRPPRDGTADNIAPGGRCLFRLDAGLFDDRPPQLDLGGKLVAVRLGRRLVERQQVGLDLLELGADGLVGHDLAQRLVQRIEDGPGRAERSE